MAHTDERGSLEVQGLQCVINLPRFTQTPKPCSHIYRCTLVYGGGGHLHLLGACIKYEQINRLLIHITAGW